jgi:putative CocE/NonD family hydrolase
MLLIGGWHDPHLRGILELWHRSRAAGGTPWLRIGAWTHLDWDGGIDRLQLAFFQHHLQHKSSSEDLEAPVLLQDSRTHLWQAPSAPAKQPSWGLRSSGLAAIDPEEGELVLGQSGSGSVTVVHDPWRPVPGRGGHLGLDAGPCERSDLDRRGDVACFTSAPLAQPLTLEGRPQLRLRVEADQPSFDLCAALSVLEHDGSSVHQLCTGVGRFRQQAGNTGALQLALQPLSARLERGQRLRLSLAGSAWPQIAVNPGDGSVPQGPSGPRHRVISLGLDLAEAQLRLLPLLDAEVGAN